MSKLIIVSHRLPYTCSIEDKKPVLKPSVGGLATGLLPLLQQNAVWIGWNGSQQRLSKAETAAIEQELAQRNCLALALPVEKQKTFYNEVANGIIWPLYHYHADHIPLHLQGWEAYEEINRIYAEFIVKQVEPGDTVWIHDYHLQILPQMLRERRLKIRIGFFLHIPFPAYEVFRILPWREEILEGILGADLVGFHTHSYGQYFQDAVSRILGLECEDGSVVLDKRRVEIDAFPLGVDFNQWNQVTAHDQSNLLANSLLNLKTEHPFLRFLLSVDRLDYTKGIPRKLLAFERLLEQHEELRGLVSLVQIAPPSRDSVPVYSRNRKQVEELVGRINGRYGLPGYQPVQYIARAFSSEEISLLYPITDVMVVTPLRDGMNLVAKEFIASRLDEDGVLVLSELAGAAAELQEALQVNPYDIDKTASVLYEAVTMDADERRQRMKILRGKIRDFDTHSWARTFVERLQHIEEVEDTVAFQSPKDIALAIAEKQGKIVLFIDYESTLGSAKESPMVETSLKLLLSRLSRSERCELHLLSDRKAEELRQAFGSLQLHLHAEHGAWALSPGHTEPVLSFRDATYQDLLDRAISVIEELVRRTAGATLERRAASLIWHYRLPELAQGERTLREARERLRTQFNADYFDMIPGKRSLELRLKVARYSRLIARRAEAQDPCESLLIIGSDAIDEELFTTAASKGWGITVGTGKSQAQFRLRDSGGVRELLRYLELFLASPSLPNFQSPLPPRPQQDGRSPYPVFLG